MIKTSVAKQIGANIKKTKQTALQADGITPLSVIGEVHLNMSRNGHTLHLDALVVNDLDVDVLAGTPFMASNDVSITPSSLSRAQTSPTTTLHALTQKKTVSDVPRLTSCELPQPHQ